MATARLRKREGSDAASSSLRVALNAERRPHWLLLGSVYILCKSAINFASPWKFGHQNIFLGKWREKGKLLGPTNSVNWEISNLRYTMAVSWLTGSSYVENSGVQRRISTAEQYENCSASQPLFPSTGNPVTEHQPKREVKWACVPRLHHSGWAGDVKEYTCSSIFHIPSQFYVFCIRT